MGDLTLNKPNLDQGSTGVSGANAVPTPGVKPEVETPVEETETVSEVYLLNGVEKYQLDRWKFEGGMLILTDPEEIEAFEKVWKENRHRGYAARITQVDDSTLDIKALKDKLVAKAVQGAEDSEKRARQLNPAG